MTVNIGPAGYLLTLTYRLSLLTDGDRQLLLMNYVIRSSQADSLIVVLNDQTCWQYEMFQQACAWQLEAK